MKPETPLFVIFGLPTWALVDGTWSSLSQLADRLPEGYNISAYLILSLTLGNIFPIAIGYALEKFFSPSLLENLIYWILTIGAFTGILMGVFYDYSVSVGGSDVSLPLCILFFIVGGCSSSSNVTHFTYVSTFSAQSTTALGTGMGFGSMIAGILGILQGVWLIDYGFNTTIYYIVLSVLYVPAMYSFYQLNHHYALSPNTSKHEISSFLGVVEENPVSSPILTNQDHQQPRASPEITHYRNSKERSKSSHFIWQYAHILSLQAFNSSLGYGIVPALISYACGKFPNANTILLFATGTAAIVDPWSRFCTNFYHLNTYKQLLYASSVLFFLALGLIICSVIPPSSSFYIEGNSFLPVVLYICFNALFGYTNISIFRYFKEKASITSSSSSSETNPNNLQQISDKQIQNAYRYSGVASQVGALLGSILAFSLVVTNSL